MGKLSEKADVYSYGVLLLEVVSGRKNLDYNMPAHKVYLSDWVSHPYSTTAISLNPNQLRKLSIYYIPFSQAQCYKQLMIELNFFRQYAGKRALQQLQCNGSRGSSALLR